MGIDGLLEVTEFVLVTSKLVFELLHDGPFDRVLFLLGDVASYALQECQQMILKSKDKKTVCLHAGNRAICMQYSIETKIVYS